MNEIELRQLDLEYDERQYNLMIQRIHEFMKGELYLISLIGDLSGLLNALILPVQVWKDTFKSYWMDLDVLYSVAFVAEETHFDSDDQKTVIKAIENLEKMIKLKLYERTYDYSNCIWKL